MTPEPLLRSLPRRQPPHLTEFQPQIRRHPDGSDWPFWGALIRSIRWLGFGLRLGGRLAWDRRTGPLSTRQVASRLRNALEDMGGPAVKIGQQLANRVDLLPFEFCSELSRLTDRVRPFPAEEAIAEIERAIHGPLESVFSAFDPKPIGSASIACVYQALLLSGEKVAVKVQRPGIANQFATDLAIIAFATRTMEALSMVRPSFFHFFRQEVRTMFLEELDFTLEARFQHHYRRYIERDGLNWLTCPRLWREWCSQRVLVAEFIDGIPCAEVIAAAETRDKSVLEYLSTQKINPRRVGLNIVRLGLWSNYELPFIHGDPHPANIMVLPENRLCMLDFGACSLRARRTVVNQRHLMQHIVNDEVSEVTAAALADISPLPAIDIDAFRRDIEAKMLLFQCGLRDPSSSWFERTTVVLWVHLLDAIKSYNLPVNPDTLRTFRATLLYDTLALRLNPRLTLAVTRRYLQVAPRRAVKRARKRLKQNRAGAPFAVLALQHWIEQSARIREAEYKMDTLTLGIIPNLQRLVGGSARVGRWLAFWIAIVFAVSWCCAPGAATWLIIALGCSLTGLRLVHFLRGP